MFKISVSGRDGENLNEALDRVLDGELSDLAEVVEAVPQMSGGRIFAADPSKTVSFVIRFRGEPTSKLVAAITAALRKIIGAQGDIEVINE
ncbi:MAG: hypothetical protein ACSHXB_17590 [Sulfitobacter sp.]